MRAQFPLLFVGAVIGFSSWAMVGLAAEPNTRSINEGIRIDALQPASPQSPFVRAEGPHQPFEGIEFAFGASFEYTKGILRQIGVDSAGNTQALATLVDHALLARVAGSITPLPWLSFELNIPFALVESGDSPKPYGSSSIPSAASAPGFGDLRFGAHARPIDDKRFGLLFGGRFWAPTGSELSYLSDKRFRAELDVGFASELEHTLFGCTLDVAPGFLFSRNGDRLALGCAGHVKTTGGFSFGLEPSFALLSLTDIREQTRIAVLAEPLAAARFNLGDLHLGLALGPSFGGAPGAAQFRSLFTLAYTGGGHPPKVAPVAPPDRDLDKIPDAQDACPDEAGPTSREAKQRGCPARDRDGDGVRDDEDACPDRAGISHANVQANGCPDSDNDSLPDPIDACLNEPGQPSNGCPQYARLRGAEFEIQPPIEFGKDDKLAAEGRSAIEEIAATVRANPTLQKVSISVGAKGAPPKLADKRAQQILRILRSGNLNEKRYEVIVRDDMAAGAVIVHVGGG